MNYFVLAAPRAPWAIYLVGTRKKLIGLAMMAASCVVTPAMAVVYPDEVNAYIDAEIERFIDAPGFFQVDPAYFDSPEWNSVERFPFGDSPYTDYRDWGMSDAGKAIMALEAFEQALPHTRYLVSVTHVDGNAEYPNVVRLVEVVRFNVGPALAASNRAIYGDHFAPSAEEIRAGGDVAWRFAMFSSQGLPNQITALSRRILSQVDAQRYDCLGLPCLALADSGDETTNWTSISVDEDGDIQPYRTRDARGLSVPTRVADLLSDQALYDEDVEMVISRDVIGQEIITNGVLWRADHKAWIRRTEIAGLAAYWAQTETKGVVDLVYAFQHGLEAPAWRYTLLFETDRQETRRYEVLTNGENVAYRHANIDFIGTSEMPSRAYARIPGRDVAVDIWPANPLPQVERFLGIRLFDTGRREQMGRHLAHELRLVASLPSMSSPEHRVWTGPVWVIPDLPSAPGWQSLPGSPFAGRAQGLAEVWDNVARTLDDEGLIARAEITLHSGVTREQLANLLTDDTDNSILRLGGAERQTVLLRIGNLEQAADGELAAVFGAPQLLGVEDWPGTLPASTMPLLDQ